MHSAQELISTVDRLIFLPSVFMRVRDLLASDNSSVADIARSISADPALTTQLLHVANSALYGYQGKIDNVPRALTILGLKQVHDLVLAMSLSQAFQHFRPQNLDIQRFWQTSVLCGVAAHEIGTHSMMASRERLLTIGLLSNIGHLVMYQATPELTHQVFQVFDRSQDTPLSQIEQHIIGCDFSEVGATLMDHWRLPPMFARIIGTQLMPQVGGEYMQEACAIHLAMHIAQAQHYDENDDSAASKVSSIVWENLSLTPSEFAIIRKSAAINASTLLAALIPDIVYS